MHSGPTSLTRQEITAKQNRKNKVFKNVAKNLRDAMGAEDDDDGSGIFVICVEVPNRHWAVGVNLSL